MEILRWERVREKGFVLFRKKKKIPPKRRATKVGRATQQRYRTDTRRYKKFEKPDQFVFDARRLEKLNCMIRRDTNAMDENRKTLIQVSSMRITLKKFLASGVRDTPWKP